MTHIAFRRVTAEQSNTCLAVAAAVRIRQRLTPAVLLCRPLNARSPRESTAPLHCLSQERRLRRRSADDEGGGNDAGCGNETRRYAPTP